MLNDKVALITGAGQGIGQGIALALAKRGVKIVAAGRTLAKCEQTCRLIAERHGTDALALSCDVTMEADLELPHARSPALEKWMERHPEEAAEFVRGIPLLRVGDCEADIGEFVAVLCGPESSYISGQSIAVDGGQAYMG